MPTIRIDDEVFEYLKRDAEPFKDTPNDVLRRLFGLNDSALKGGEQKTIKRSTGTKTPPIEYRLPILEALAELGGAGRVNEILEIVFQKVRDKLTAFDLEELPSGIEVRWRNTACWERFSMTKQGLLRDDSKRGVWEITDKGRDYLMQKK